MKHHLELRKQSLLRTELTEFAKMCKNRVFGEISAFFEYSKILDIVIELIKISIKYTSMELSKFPFLLNKHLLDI